MTRARGRARRGQRVVAKVPGGHWKIVTILGAVRTGGPFAAATVVGATDSDVFRTYVREVLAPQLRPGDVVVMDNLAAHKVAGVREAVRAAGATVLHLPPYSPDLNPIEQLFAKLKALLRKAAARTKDALWDAIGEALGACPEAECRNYLAHCGYEFT